MKFSDIAKKRFIVLTEISPNTQTGFALKAKDSVDGIIVKAPKLEQSTQQQNPEMQSIKKAIELKKQGIESAATITCRDHPREDGEITNMISESKIENILALWGEPHNGPYKGGYNFADTIALIKWLKEQELETCFIVSSDPSATKKPWQISALKKKTEAGASITITQPIFDIGLAKRFFEKARMEADGLKLIAGLMPVSNVEEISFVQNIRGIGVPEEAQRKLLSNENGGFEFVLQIAEELRERVDGFHLFPLGEKEKNIELLKQLR